MKLDPARKVVRLMFNVFLPVDWRLRCL